MYAILPFVFLLFLGVIAALSYSIGKKISTKLSIRLLGVYLLVLLLSPFLAAFTGNSGDAVEEITNIPPDYYLSILENYSDYTLEDLQKDDFLAVLDEQEISIDAENFSVENPFIIFTSTHHADGWSDRDFENYLIVEKTTAVEDVIITQFQQRAFISGVEVTDQFEPWQWFLEQWSRDQQRLNVELHRSDIQLYSLWPLLQAFQFDQATTNRTFAREIPSIDSGTIHWIQVPERLSINLQGKKPFRIID